MERHGAPEKYFNMSMNRLIYDENGNRKSVSDKIDELQYYNVMHIDKVQEITCLIKKKVR